MYSYIGTGSSLKVNLLKNKATVMSLLIYNAMYIYIFNKLKIVRIY
jgi:hypothetical protein